MDDTTYIQRINRNYYKLSYINKLENAQEIDRLLETYYLLKLSHDDTRNLSRLITNTSSESVIKNLSTKKSTGLDVYTAEFPQTFQALIPFLLKLFKNLKGVLTIPSMRSASP